ncbi:MAG: hypothetical protein KatS3mg011_2184 [Acidimicrobiia bacterium]|nr:MAG: hypothetical protein KatS3mg011_2184 [Acidimicrobiia bacterium]
MLIRILSPECDEQCPELLTHLVKSGVLVDYRLTTVGEVQELVVPNKVDAISSVVQTLTLEGVPPGEHCIAVFFQDLRVDDGEVIGREGMMGWYRHLNLSPEESETPSIRSYCSTDGLPVAEGTFVPLEAEGCRGLPNGITTDPTTGTRLPDGQLMVLVPTCPQDLVADTPRDLVRNPLVFVTGGTYVRGYGVARFLD